jgi:hypothetical protein
MSRIKRLDADLLRALSQNGNDGYEKENDSGERAHPIALHVA